MSYAPSSLVPLNGASPPYGNANPAVLSSPNPNTGDAVPFVMKKPEDILSLQIRSKDVNERLALLEQKVNVLADNFQPKPESGTDWAFTMFVTWICLMVVSIIITVVVVVLEKDKYEKVLNKSEMKRYIIKKKDKKAKKALKVEEAEEEEEEQEADEEEAVDDE